MPYGNRNPQPGQWLKKLYREKLYRCQVAQIGNSIGYRLEDGREFKTSSGAGAAIRGGTCNGFVFWDLEQPVETSAVAVMAAVDLALEAGPQPPDVDLPVKSARVRQRKPKAAPAELPPAAAAKPSRRRAIPWIKRSAHQQNVPQGSIRYFCDGCCGNFEQSGDGLPEQCPSGHPAHGYKSERMLA